MKELDDAIIASPSTTESETEGKEEISKLNSKEEQPVSGVDGIMQENISKEKLLESDGSCLNEQLNEKDDNISSFKEDLGKIDEAVKQISDVDEALVEKEEKHSTVNEGFGEHGGGRLQLNEALIQSCEKDDKVSSFEGVLVEKEENVLIMEQGTANNDVSDFDGACLNEQLNMGPPQVDEEDNNVSLNEVVIVKNEKVSTMEEVFREKEEANADIDVEVMCKKTDENHVNFDETHLNEQLNEELPQVDEEANIAFPKEVDIVENEKVSTMEEVFREKEEANADIDMEVMCKKTDEDHANFDEALLNEQLTVDLAQVDEEANKASLRVILAVEKEKVSILEERFGKNEKDTVDIANDTHKLADEKHLHCDGEHINEHPNEESPETDEKNLASQETLVANVSSLDKRVDGVSIYDSDKVMHHSVENKSNVSLSKFTESLNEKDVTVFTLQDEPASEEEKASSFKDVNAQKASAHEPSAPNLDVNVVKEQSIEELNAQSIGGESIYDSNEVMHDCVENKSDFSISKFTESLNEKDVKPSTLQDEAVTEEEKASSFKDENGQKVSAHEHSAPNLDVDVVKEQSIEELNVQSIGGGSIYESNEIMRGCVENKSDVSMSKFTESINEKDVKSILQDEHVTEEEKASSFKDENGQKLSAHEPSAPNLDVNVVEEQAIEELNARDENFSLLQEPSVIKDQNRVTLNNDLVAVNMHSEGLVAKSETNLSMKEGFDRIEITKVDNDKNILQQEITPNKVEDSTDKQDEVDEMDIDEGGPAISVGKRSTMKRKSGQTKQSQSKRIRVRQKHKEDESLCFICFDGGDLVVCDHRRCPKVYHPLCVNREEEYFKAKGQWICGWHICNSCEKNAHYMCYTCTYSMCKGCFKSSEFACVRGSKGFCKGCIEIVVAIEMKKGADQIKDMGEVDELFLFKDYWLELNEKLSLTMEELTRASNQLQEPNVAATDKEQTITKIRAGKREVEPSEDNPDNAHEEKPGSSSRRLKRNKETTSSAINKLKKRLRRPKNVSTSSEWASKELLDFVAHMKDGDRSKISQFDVQDLLLAYIKQHNLRDPSKKSQIVCDSMLLNLFGKSRVGHLEMLKLLEPHFLIEETSPLATDENEGGVVDPDPNRVVSEGSSDTFSKTTSDKRRKSNKNSGENKPSHNDETYAAVDVHNVSKMYLRRNLIENLLDDADTFNEKVLGAFVRIRITGSAPNKDLYRLVQIVGTGKAASTYNTGRKTTDITLEIVNLSKREFFTIDLISNQEFTAEECKRLRQSVRCGLIDRMTVTQAQEKANALHAVKVNDALESEKLRFSNLRDRASEQGRKKEHRLSVEKLQMLSTPEELSRRLNELPEIHIDPNMDLDYVSSDDEQDENVRSQDNRKASVVAFRDVSKKLSIPKNEGNDIRQSISPITPKSETKTINTNMSAVNNALPIRAPVQPSNIPPQSSAQIPSTTPNLNENEKMWHYVDPSGKIQGPFSMTQLRKWNANKFFPINLRIWRTTEKQEDSVLLTDALDGKLNKASHSTNIATLVDPRVNNLSANNSSSIRQSPITNASQPTNMKPLVDSKASNFSATSSPIRQSQLHSNDNAGPNSRNPENNSRWSAGQNRQSNWDSERPNRRFQSNNNDNNRGKDRQNVHQSTRNQQFSTQQMNLQPSNVPQGKNIDWAGLQGAINNILPSANLNKVEPSQINPISNVDIQPTNDQNAALNPSSAPTVVTDASAQQQQQIATANMNMPYQAVPNAANMNWGMMAQAPMNMNNMNWGGAANMNMGWGPPLPAQQMANPNTNVGWVMPPGQGMPMQVNPNAGWVAPVVGNGNPNASWVAPQAGGVNADHASNSQANPNSVIAPVGVCCFFKNGHCKKGISCKYLHS